jgi:hypothetical protein
VRQPPLRLENRIVPRTPSSLEGKLATAFAWGSFLCLFAHNFCMGEMKRANAYDEDRRRTERYACMIAICASIIAAARLAREDIGHPSPFGF